ncbi:zinc knuckle CX2CX4HX4C containing protein [Tanacetum coccineum]|uniref:Zinc knuckle CX2CX4HX4C containing protein n=1 Tax=Tanacetum coccineum TaxID=301880 RepID=A0ABQ4ZVC7_9ASTR
MCGRSILPMCSQDGVYTVEAQPSRDSNFPSLDYVYQTAAKNVSFGGSRLSYNSSVRDSSNLIHSEGTFVSSSLNIPIDCKINVAEIFCVPFNALADIDNLTRDIEMGKHEKSFEDNDPNNSNSGIGGNKAKGTFNDDTMHLEELIVQSVTLQDIPHSYVGAARGGGASAKDHTKVNSNFRPLVADPVFDGVNISIPRKVVENVSTRFEHTLYGYFIGKRMAFLVVEYYARSNWAKHGLKSIMMNTKGFFFFKFESLTGLEDVLEGGPWLIRKSLIILKKWSMDTRLLKEDLTRIPIWVKLHDVPIQVFEEDCISLIDTFIGNPVMLDSYTSSMCNDSDGFTKETIRVDPPIVTTSNVVTPTVVETNDGFQTMGKKKKRKGKLKSTNGGQFVGPSVKQSLRYEPKTTTSAPKKGATNSNSFSAMNDEEEDEEENVENMYDESANLFTNTKTGGNSSFTADAS